MKRVAKSIIIVVLIGIVVMLVARTSSSGSTGLEQTFTSEDVSVSTMRRIMNSYLKSQDPKTLYGQVKDLATLVPYGRAHVGMHIFGETLFRVKGLDGVGVCDDSFGFGCFHGFFGIAIALEGPEILDDFDKACIAQYGELGLGCQHGIGHGLGEYYGPIGLTEQLAACEKLSWKGTFFGCSGGVFMEYNFPTMVGEDGGATQTRQFDPQRQYAPCTDVADRFRQSCFLELASWYVQILDHDWKQIDALCTDIVADQDRRACFLGSGVAMVPEYKYDVQKAEELCSLFSSSEGTMLCLSGASWSFFAHPEHREKAKRICETASDSMRCARDSDLINVPFLSKEP